MATASSFVFSFRQAAQRHLAENRRRGQSTEWAYNLLRLIPVAAKAKQNTAIFGGKRAPASENRRIGGRRITGSDWNLGQFPLRHLKRTPHRENSDRDAWNHKCNCNPFLPSYESALEASGLLKCACNV